jgi:hypothetical protein
MEYTTTTLHKIQFTNNLVTICVHASHDFIDNAMGFFFAGFREFFFCDGMGLPMQFGQKKNLKFG